MLGFLAVHDDRAFKAREIASQVGLDEGAVSTALSRLKDRDLVEHKATYWAITDDEDNRISRRRHSPARWNSSSAGTPIGTAFDSW